MRTRFAVRMLLALLFAGLSSAQAQPYEIGVFYFPGWKDHQHGAPSALPWEPIKKYPHLEPLLGWYDEGRVAIAEQHIEWMSSYGLTYVVYDWYWSAEQRSFLEHALEAYKSAKNNHLIKFSILWANHTKVPQNLLQFTSMVQYWTKNVFPHKQYLQIDSKPVVFVFSQTFLRDNAASFGMTSKELIDIAQRIAQQAGYKGIYFVASAPAARELIVEHGPQSGYAAFSAYDYRRAYTGTLGSASKLAHSFRELSDAYRTNWNWIATNSPLPYIVPMTMGWDMRPWGGNKDPLHDHTVATPEEFEQHLVRARDVMDRHPGKTMRMGIICCWNEYGEGPYIEPTKGRGFAYLEKIAKVFKSPQRTPASRK